MEKPKGINFTSIDTPTFKKDNQYVIDFRFADQLRDSLEKINNKFPLVKLNVDDFDYYDGMFFIPKGHKARMTFKQLEEYANKLNNQKEIERKDRLNKIYKEFEEEKAREEEDKRNTQLYGQWD